MIGASGQVGTELVRQLPPDRLAGALKRPEIDLSRPATLRNALNETRPDIVINAAAYTAVDKAESEPDTARAINAEAPALLAEQAGRLGFALLHISTDYAYDGTGDQPVVEGQVDAPLNVYGATKAAGDAAVLASAAPHIVLRTSWVFSAHGSNFVKTMLRLGREREALSIVADQIGGPTPAAAIAAALIRIADSLQPGEPRRGLYHFSGAPETSWHGFAQAIFAGASKRGRKTPGTVSPITTADYPTPATRPLNSRLSCEKIEKTFGLARPDWQAGLNAVLDELLPGAA